jgi:hypothetical protein
MCRVYPARTGWYVRLCYYHGARVGEHMPVAEGYELPGAHYPRARQTGVRIPLRGVAGPKRSVRELHNIPRCYCCGAPLSRDNTPSGVCSWCMEHPERRPAVPYAARGKDGHNAHH